MIVRVLCEDFRKDQYLVKPIVEAMLGRLRKPRTRVEVVRDPVLGSVTAALKWSRVEPILDRYRGMTDVFLLIVDRDGDENRSHSLQALEKRASESGHPLLIAENAWQEIEVWALAGQEDLPSSWSWSRLRAEPHPKETYFEPWVRERGLEDSPGEGRLILGLEAGKRYVRVKKLCPEDVGSIHARLEEHLASSI
jgi:hypothetical protein